MTKEYSEDMLVEQSVIDIFMKELDYDDFQNCMDEWKTGKAFLVEKQNQMLFLSQD